MCTAGRILQHYNYLSVQFSPLALMAFLYRNCGSKNVVCKKTCSYMQYEKGEEKRKKRYEDGSQEQGFS